MTSPAHFRTPALLTVLFLLLPMLAVLLQASPSSSTTAARASLTVSPRDYIGGQRLVFEGNIGRTGKRTLRLQLNLGREGDPWQTIDRFRPRTRANGDFRFGYRAPAMFGKYMRVVSKGGLATPSWKFYATSQDLVVWADAGGDLNEVVAGDYFDIRVDTTPTREELKRRTDVPPPALPGRTLTLQRRIEPAGPFGYVSQWQTLRTTTTDGRGAAKFAGLTVPTPGTVVYRVRQEDWTENGDRVGWYPSFPTYVRVLSPAGADNVAEATPGTEPAVARTAVPESSARAAVGSKTAAERFEWRPSLWGFAWGYGESLTTRPADGAARQGWWLDAATGTGRAAKHNGGLQLDSQRQNDDDDQYDNSYGTTAATMRDNPMRTGRWEVRLRTKSTERDDADARVRVELVPDRASDYACGARNITIAEVLPHESSVLIGARNSAGKEWTRTVPNIRTKDVSAAFAVEVGKKHITWFREGRPIGTVQNPAAVPEVPMTLRLSLVGPEDREMDRTQAIFDWMRGYPLGEGRQVKSGNALKPGTHGFGC